MKRQLIRQAIHERFGDLLDDSNRSVARSFSDLNGEQIDTARMLFEFSSVYAVMYVKHIVSDDLSDQASEFVFDSFGR